MKEMIFFDFFYIYHKIFNKNTFLISIDNDSLAFFHILYLEVFVLIL